jgi:UDP-3-O-[3-hydroxymyristoyl] glucosamine N-acyltransferase
MEFSYELSDLLRLLSPERVVGSTSAVISRISTLEEAGEGDVAFLGNAKYRKKAEHSRASVLLLPMNFVAQPIDGQCLLFFKNPSMAIGVLSRDIEVRCAPRRRAGIHPSAVVDGTASLAGDVSVGANVVIEAGVVIGEGSVVMAGCYLGYGVEIGPGSILYPGVKVMDFCEIGARCRIYPGVVVGADGFGYETIGGVNERLPQIGNVVIGDDVDIGANTTIDRARFGHTRIGRGTKIDNLVQIGHNVVVGEHCLIAAQTGISGSTALGNHVALGGQVGIAGHIEIPDGIMVAGKSSVAGYHAKYGKVLRGIPAIGITDINRLYVLWRKLPEVFARLERLENRPSEKE